MILTAEHEQLRRTISAFIDKEIMMAIISKEPGILPGGRK